MQNTSGCEKCDSVGYSVWRCMSDRWRNKGLFASQLGPRNTATGAPLPRNGGPAAAQRRPYYDATEARLRRYENAVAAHRGNGPLLCGAYFHNRPLSSSLNVQKTLLSIGLSHVGLNNYDNYENFCSFSYDWAIAPVF